MKKYRIAQVGSFDVENYGDLLFEEVFKKKIAEQIEIDEIVLFAPKNCKLAFNESRQVFSVVEMEKMHRENKFDAIVIGGGDLIHFEKIKALMPYLSDSPIMYESLYIWTMPIFIALKHDIPILWNCPGVPQDFLDSEKKLVKELVNTLDYIAVRDDISKQRLLDCKIEKEISVFPDTVIIMSEIFDKEYLKQVLDELSLVFDSKDSYIVFHANSAWDEAERKAAAIELLKIKKNLDCTIVLQPIGYALGDMETLKEIQSYYPDQFVLVEKKLAPIELLSVISSCKLYVGSSLHGCITANAYLIPAIACNCSKYTKIDGYFQFMQNKDFLIEQPDQIFEAVQKASNFNTDDIKKMWPLVQTHFANMAKIIQKTPATKSISQLGVEVCDYEHESRLKEMQLHNTVLEMSETKTNLILEKKQTEEFKERYFSNKNELRRSRNELYKMRDELIELKEDLERVSESFAEIQSSASWKITKPLRTVLDTSKRIVWKSKNTKLIRKTIKSIKQNGFKGTIKKANNYIERKREIKKFYKESGIQLDKNNNKIYSPYESVYQDNHDFSGKKTDVKAMAFYLPQFHQIQENDEWWGEGFTEWVNTSKSVPRFKNHYQPREPHDDIGYYDLSNVNTLKKQVDLANKHGIHGFCFYHYWFSGKRLLEKPVDMLMEHPEIDTNFCLCWANENWTKAWDGQNKEVLMSQTYSDEDIPLFIEDLNKYFSDPRYIRIDGKPLLIVYNPGEIPDIEKTFLGWRKRAKELGIGEIIIWTCRTANNTAKKLDILDFIDGELEFPPHNMWWDIIGMRDVETIGKAAGIYDYRKLVDVLKNKFALAKNASENSEVVPVYRTCMMGWDNAARRKTMWTSFYGFSLRSFYTWLNLIVDEARNKFKEEERFVFINAWNEWAEGTYLEPDAKFGYANINTVSKVLFDIPFDEIKVLDDQTKCSSEVKISLEKPEIAVQIHLFYIDTLDEIIDNINHIPYPYDCFISTDDEKKKKIIEAKFATRCTAKNVNVAVMVNRGRDVAPLLVQLKDVINNYKYICHIHSKKTATNDYGVMWRKYLYRHLFGTKKNVANIIGIFENNPDVGLVFPETFPVIENQAIWGSNEVKCALLMKKLGIKSELDAKPVFPVGNMFWAKVEAVKSIFEHGFNASDFPQESGQVNMTLAHQIERIWCYLAQDAGYDYCKTFNNSTDGIELPAKRRIVLFVHYDKGNIVSKADEDYIRYLSSFAEEVVFITNSLLAETELNKVSSHVSKIIERSNVGFDFGAWRDGLFEVGFEYLDDFDELLLINNSCYCADYDFSRIFCVMEAEPVDFWGITLFPLLEDGSYINKKQINEHIQTYFQVFNQPAFSSESFKNFWLNVKDETELIDVIANCETELTKTLKDSGFKYDVYIKETRILSKFRENYAIPYELPLSLLLLGSPFVKKKSENYMSFNERTRVRDFVKQMKK